MAGLKQRLDLLLVERGLATSREEAQALIMAGDVYIDGSRANRAAEPVAPEVSIEVRGGLPFVSRGGHKLTAALDRFAIAVAGCTCGDIGASTGGFTDCLLQHGAAKVYAVDVGQGQLAWKLRGDPRVVVMEKTNARSLTPNGFPAPFLGADIVVVDCSFISLRKILPPAIAMLRPTGKVVALVKPQFEAGRAEVNKGAGVITDPAIHARVMLEMKDFVRDQTSLEWKGETESPLLGPAGNKEFLILLEKKT